MKEAPPEIQAIVAKHAANKKLTPQEVEALKKWKEESSDATPDRPKYADSLAQAASMLDLSPSILSAAKRAGCSAFKGSRVYLDDLEEFLENNDLSGADGIGEKEKVEIDIKREDLRKKRFENEVSEGLYISRADQAKAYRSIAENQKRILRSALEKRFPEIAENKSKRELRELGADLYNEICQEFQSLDY